MSSLYDPVPKIVNEAIACSKPVLLRDTVGFAGDFIEHKKNGYIYKSENIEDMIKGFKMIKNNSNKKEVKESCEIKYKTWTPEQNARSVVNLLIKFLNY